MREVFSVHDTNVVNNFSPYLLEVTELIEAMGEEGFEGIRQSITRRHNTVAQYIVT